MATKEVRQLFWIVCLALFLAACSNLTPPAGDDLVTQGVVKKDHYIVVLNQNASPAQAAANRARAAEVAREHGVRPLHTYGAALVGLSAEVPEGRLNALRHDPRVAYVEPVLRVQATDQSLPTGIRRIYADSNDDIGIDGTDDLRVDVDVAVGNGSPPTDSLSFEVVTVEEEMQAEEVHVVGL